MFRQGKKTAAASGVAATSAAAGTAAAAAPIGTKIAAGIAAALLTVTAAGVIVHQSASEPTAPTAEATPTNQWIGYGTDLLPQFIRRFELTADESTINLCKALSPKYISAERIYHEFEKMILQGKSISRGLMFLKDTGWTKYFPEMHALIDLKQDQYPGESCGSSFWQQE